MKIVRAGERPTTAREKYDDADRMLKHAAHCYHAAKSDEAKAACGDALRRAALLFATAAACLALDGAA